MSTHSISVPTTPRVRLKMNKIKMDVWEFQNYLRESIGPTYRCEFCRNYNEECCKIMEREVDGRGLVYPRNGDVCDRYEAIK